MCCSHGLGFRMKGLESFTGARVFDLGLRIWCSGCNNSRIWPGRYVMLYKVSSIRNTLRV